MDNQSTVLASRISNGSHYNYRARLITSTAKAPVITVDQQFDSGEWGPTGGRWFLETLFKGGNPSDSILLVAGQNWRIDRGMKQAINEAIEIVLNTHRNI